MTVVTRFPPSPTGMMHIGNARTALFNWLYARHHNGKFLIRIEDTDRARHSEEAVQVILEGLDWLGLDYDNIPESQFANKQRHIDIAHELLAKGMAYKCYCSPEELELMREEAKAQGRPTAYDRRWRDKTDKDAPKDIAPVIRIKAPLNGTMIVHDKVQGEVKVAYDHLDDMIILRSDDTPTYMLAVVVDDHDMGVTHVMRGDDHLNNTFRQNLIYEAMGWQQPTYAHLPLIHGADGAKLSKRHGAVGVREFQEIGYLPETMRNYLLKLGWAHGDDEIISTEDAIKLFDFDGIGKSAAKFDYAKLENLNAHYIKQADNDRLIDLLAPFLKDHHNIILTKTALNRLQMGMDELKDRSRTLVQLAEESLIYIRDDISYSEKALKQLLSENLKTLKNLHGLFQAMDEFNADDIDLACRSYANDKLEGKLGQVMMPLRAALTGSDKSPSLNNVMAILGQKETLTRIQAAIEYIENA